MPAFWAAITALALLAGDPVPRDVPASGTTNAALASLDRMMVDFVRKHEIPGAALAVAKHGRFIYARGFGHADRDAGTLVRPDSLFRIASISKPITAAAVLKLVERGAIALDARVFDVLHLEREVDDPSALDPRWRRVTIRQLLQHTGGWDRDTSFDPMFHQMEFALRSRAEPPASPRNVIRAMLGFPLDFDPGSRFAYSNFGYCLLGRVIETASGQDYETFVRDEILAPIGISAMRIGHTFAEDRASGEVCYYTRNTSPVPSIFAKNAGRGVARPYGAFSVETLDAHGGWIASAIDLVKFAAALDETEVPGLLHPESVRILFDRPDGDAGFESEGKPRNRYYACGWRVVRFKDGRRFNAWHNGSLPGTSALLVRRHDGFCWAVLFNTRDMPGGGEPAVAIDEPIHNAIDQIPSWPDALFRGEDPTHDLRTFQDALLDATFPPEPFAQS
jgi:N-acyl-D-amino-acid deacylase